MIFGHLTPEDGRRDTDLYIGGSNNAGFDLQSDAADTEEALVAKLKSQLGDLILTEYQIPTRSRAEGDGGSFPLPSEPWRTI